MYILGICEQENHAAAALVCDGQLVAAVEANDLAPLCPVGLTYTQGICRAINFCLDRAGIGFDQINFVAYSFDSEKFFHREGAFYSSRGAQAADVSPGQLFSRCLIEKLNGLKERPRTRELIEPLLPPEGQFVFIDHHIAHGASGFYPSGFDRAAVISLCNREDFASASIMSGEGHRLILHRDATFPNSIGMVYSSVTSALGFGRNMDCHKTMWLSATGEPEFADVFEELLDVDSEGLPLVDLEYFVSSDEGELSLSKRFYERTGLRPRLEDEPITRIHRNIARSLQSRVEDVLCEMAIRLREQMGYEYLCLAGGISLNNFANAAIERRAGYKGMFVQPAASNVGCCLGAALYVWHQLLGNCERVYKMNHVFLGPQFTDEQVKVVLDNCKLTYQYFPVDDRFLAEVARLLSHGSIVGWFRGAMELGPRAMGARSILASPTDELMRDNLNRFIKRREDFHPFSAAVPEEQVEEFFESGALTEFIQSVTRARNGLANLIPAAMFGNGLVRVHSVSSKTNRPLWNLLLKFGEITGVPILLNTSFNFFGEPIVSSPREAVRNFYSSGIDCLAIENFLVKK